MNDRPNRKSAGQPPVSAHPAFPVIVALWFAALLAIGSMVLPMAIFDNFVVASGLADVYQAAQPPLGATARIVVALVAGAIGALAGLFIARKVAASSAPSPVNRRAAALRPSSGGSSLFAKRPISAHEELGEGGLDADDEPAAPRDAFAGRRRALAVTEESARSEFLSFAPLPGQSPNSDHEPLDLLAFAEPEAIEPQEADEAAMTTPVPERELAPAPEPAIAAHDVVFGSATLSDRPAATSLADFPAEAPADDPAPFTRKSEPDTAAPVAAAPIAERALGELGVVELVERFAIALQRHRELSEAVPTAAPVEFDPPFIRTSEPVAESDLEDPSGLTAWLVDEAPQVRAIPAALRPFGFDEALADDEVDDVEALPDYDLTAALAHNREAIAAPAEQEATAAFIEPMQEAAYDEEPEENAEAEYTSLLAMKSPFGHSREPVRIDDFDDDEDGDEPVVVFPGQAARRAAPASDGPARDAVHSLASVDSPRSFDAPIARAEQAAALNRASFAQPAGQRRGAPGDTERALREALEKLQKMSGAA